MAPKRKEAEAEPTADAPRRSGRTSAPNSSASSKVASKAKPAAPKPASKKAEPASKKPKVDTVEKEEKEAEKEDVQAEEKVEDASGGVGAVVKDVTLKNEDGEDVSLASLYAENGLVIFSYPRANTPGCTTQACGYRDIYDDITATGYKVFGLSTDAPKAQLSWKTGKKLQYSLLSDPSRVLLKALGATEAKKRCHWVIEKGGKLLEAKIGVKPADDPKNALDFIKSL